MTHLPHKIRVTSAYTVLSPNPTYEITLVHCCSIIYDTHMVRVRIGCLWSLPNGLSQREFRL